MLTSHPTDALQLDNQTLFFLLGALLDAIDQTGPLPKKRITNVLAEKARRTPPMAASVNKLIKVMNNE